MCVCYYINYMLPSSCPDQAPGILVLSQSNCLVGLAYGSCSIEMITERKKERSILLMLCLRKIEDRKAEAGEGRTGDEGKEEVLSVVLIKA